MPSRKRIKRIELDKFRGATATTALDFDVAKPIVIVFGENGCGKSTIGNAIDFVCNQTKGSLETISSTDHTHIVSIGSDPSELRVRLYRGQHTWEAVQTGRRFIVNPTENIPKAKVLRRSELLRLVEASPSQRFESIRSFIDFDRFEVSEQKLRDASRNSKQALDRYAELYTQAVNLLDALWKQHNSEGVSADLWATSILKSDLTAYRNSIAELNVAISSIESFGLARNGITSARTNLETAKVQLDELLGKLAAYESDGMSGGAMVEMLNRVNAVISAPYNKNECPACGSEYNLEALRNQVKERIRSLKAADELNQSIARARQSVKSKEAVLDEAYSRLALAIKAISASLNESLGKTADLGTIQADLNAATEATKVIGNDQLDVLYAELADLRDKLQAKLDELKKEINLFDSLKPVVDQIKSTKEDVEAEDKISKRLEKAYDVARRTRIEVTQKILDDVFDTFKSYWDAIHPGEAIRPTKLSLSETTRGSLSQLGAFGEHEDIAPQAYFSESHLDTLGFCYWLAIAKYSSNGDIILVLDDIFTSVDVDHLDRIMDLLDNESESFNQIIFTTHQRRWHDTFKYGERHRHNALVLELGPWNLTQGINVYSSQMEVERLEEILKAVPLDRQSICGKAGVLLEHLFDQLSKHYRCSMPRKDEYTLADYVNGTKRLFGQLRTKYARTDGTDEEVRLLDIFNELIPFITVRNQVGAHFNLTAAEFGDAEILKFGNLTVQLIRGLICTDCSGLAMKENRHTGEWACGCKKTRMFPKSL